MGIVSFAPKKTGVWPLAVLYALLRGACSINKVSCDILVQQNTCFDSIPFKQVNLRTADLTLNKLANIPASFEWAMNKELFDFFLVEYCACLWAFKKKQGIVCLVHSYRILERLAFCLPMMYAKKSNSFKKSFQVFKDFFNLKQENTGELPFFKEILPLIIDEVTLSSTFDYIITPEEEKALKCCFTEDMLNKTSGSDISTTLSLNMLDTISLIIQIRNKFFHALSGKPHLEQTRLINPDETFMKLTTNFINVLSYIMCQISESILEIEN